jgi:starvation-inducible outer membrane lipoprotein
MKTIITLCLLLSGCSTLKPMYIDGKHELGVAESGGWNVVIRSRQIAVKKEF